MEPLTTATAFATVVSLVGQFRSERGATKQAEIEEFLGWLVDTQHADIRELVESNLKTSTGIKALLNEQHDVLMERLAMLDRALAGYASGLPGFADIGEALQPAAALSEQAFSILQQFSEQKASKALEMPMMGGVALHFLDGGGGFLEIKDEQFIEDDLRRLEGLGLLHTSLNDSGNSIYHFTRAAARLVEQVRTVEH